MEVCEGTDVDMDASGLELNLATDLKDEDRATAVNPLFMQLHDFEGGENGVEGCGVKGGINVVGLRMSGLDLDVGQARVVLLPFYRISITYIIADNEGEYYNSTCSCTLLENIWMSRTHTYF